MDEYMYLRDEIDSAYGSVINIKFLDGKPHGVEKIFGSNTSHQIKTRFPFLSFYEGYKDYIRSENQNFVSDFLFDVVQDLERQLRNMSITRLKYEVTKSYLQRRYFYDIGTQRLVHVDLSDETFNAIKRLQDEIGIYIEEMKKSEYEREKFERQSYEKDQARMRFQRRLNTLTDSDKKVISLKDILPDNGIGGIIIDASQISIIERFCKYGREENESYSFINYYILIKNTFLRGMAQKINQNNYIDDLRSELDRNGIPLNCKKDVENCINNYYESI